jgi:diguanylate cyclase (GGDEF)-like protein
MARDRADDDQVAAAGQPAASGQGGAGTGAGSVPHASSVEALCRDLATTLLGPSGAALDAPADGIESPAGAYARMLELATAHVPGASAAAIMARTSAGSFVYAASRGCELSPRGAEGAYPRPAEGGEARVRHIRHRGTDDDGPGSPADVPAPLALRDTVSETLSLPVHVGGELQAFLELYALDARHGFDERSQTLGLLLAAQLGSILQRLALEEALEAASSRLEHASQHDPLTGLPNRPLLLDRLASALARDRRAGRVTAMFLIDLGAVRQVEQEHGLAAVESLWIHSATGLRRALREADTVARCGPDDLAVVAGGVRDSESAHTIAITLQHELRRALDGVLPGLDRQAMIGVGVAPIDGATAGALLQAAEMARDEARRRGPGSVAFHADAIDATARVRERAAAVLATALDRRELRVRYEPVVRLSDRRWVALRLILDPPQAALESRRAEAVAPRSSVHALVGLADDARREEELFAALVEHASRDLDGWRALEPSRPWRVLIPVSSRLLRDGRAERTALGASRRLGLPAGAIAWSVAADRLGGVSPALLRGLASARRAGFDLIVDDVDGEGLPLRALAELPLGGLTLAPATVRSLGTDQRDDAMAAAVAALARVVGVPLGAVDVDSLATAERLETLGCVQASGPSLAALRSAEAVCRPDWAGLDVGAEPDASR